MAQNGLFTQGMSTTVFVKSLFKSDQNLFAFMPPYTDDSVTTQSLDLTEFNSRHISINLALQEQINGISMVLKT